MASRWIAGSLLLLPLLLAACAPAADGSGRSPFTTATTVHYQAPVWEVVRTLAEVGQQVQPTAAHTFLQVEALTDDSVTFRAETVGGTTIFTGVEASAAVPIRIEATVRADAGSGVAVAVVVLDGEPSRNSAVRAAKDRLIELLDQRFPRAEGG